jgi:hypothetical protein
MAVWGLMKLEHRYREALFGQAPFEILLFDLTKLGLEKTLVSIDVLLMRPQPDNSFVHNKHSH